jgi:hypothetical protein
MQITLQLARAKNDWTYCSSFTLYEAQNQTNRLYASRVCV